MAPSVQDCRLAAWYRKYDFNRKQAEAWTEKAIDFDMRGYYERSNDALKKAQSYNCVADGMLDALYALGFSETHVDEARRHIAWYFGGSR